MNRKIFYSTVLFLMVVGYQSFSQVYRTSWDNLTERQGWSQYHLGMDSNASWYYTPVAVLTGEVLIHTSPSLSSTNMTDNWMVSPLFNFGAGGSIDSLIVNLSGANQPGLTDTVGIYLITGAHNPAFGTSHLLLHQFDSTDYILNGGTYQNVAAITIPPTVGNSYLAFRYKTVNGQFNAIFDALQVTANFQNATVDLQRPTNNVNIYPNPGSGVFTIALNEKLGNIENVYVYDAWGSKLAAKYSNHLIDLSALAKGVYFLQIKTSQQDVLVKEVIIK